MTFKDQMKAADAKADPATQSDTNDDIADLLRRLNEDLRADDLRAEDRARARGRHAGTDADADEDPLDLDEGEDEGEGGEDERRHIPFGKIAAALLTAAGVGFGVVLLDQRNGAQVETTAVTPVAAPSAPARIAQPSQMTPPAPGGAAPNAPPPLVLRAQPSPPAGGPAAPAPLIARAPATPPQALPPQSAPPQPALPQVTPSQVAPPPAAPTPNGTMTTLRPAEPAPVAVAKAEPPKPEPLKPEPKAEAPKVDAAKTVAPVTATPTEPLPPPSEGARVTLPSAQPAPVEPAPPPTAAGKADTAELQAMLAPKGTPAGRNGHHVKPLAARATPAAIPAEKGEAPPPRPAASTTAVPPGRYTVQVGSFQVAENAAALARKLAAQGLRAYTLDWTDRAQRTWKVVRVGGYDSKADAARAAGDLRAGHNLPGMVVGTR